MCVRSNFLIGVVAAALTAITVVLLPTTLVASVPRAMNYQGYLTDVSSQPVTGAHALAFNLFADSTGGAPLWTEEYGSVPVTAGVFNVVLGAVNPLPEGAFTGATLWLQTSVDGVHLLPRRPLVTVAYAFRAAVADQASSELWQTDGTHVFRTLGNVGIGTSSPYTKLMVAGEAGTAALVRATDGPAQLALLSGQPGTGRQYNLVSTGSGEFQIQDTTAGGTLPFRIQGGTPTDLLYLGASGNVGIGTANPAQKLEVSGLVHAASGGFMFPDGTTQTTAAAPFGAVLDYGSSTTSSTPRTQGQLKVCYGTFQSSGCTGTVTNLPFSSASSYTVVAGRENAAGPVSQTVATSRDGGNQFTYRDVLCGGTMISWIAIGF